MRRELARPLAYGGLAAAALFAVGSIAAVAIVSEQRSSAVEQQRPDADLQRRADAAQRTIAALQAEQLAATCEAVARVVPAVALEERATAALEAAAPVADARLVLREADRTAFATARQAAADAFAGGFTTADDATLAAEYEGVDDVEAACLERADPPAAPLTGDELDEEAVAALEAQAAELEAAAPVDTARIDALNQQVTSLAAPTLATIDAVVGAGGIDETRAALDSAAEALRAQTTTDSTLDALEALAAHGSAAVARQAELDAQTQQQVVQPQPVQPAPVQPAPVQPAPAQPAPEPEPEPSQPEEPGGGDSPVDPLVP